jgi:hypothetical protein
VSDIATRIRAALESNVRTVGEEVDTANWSNAILAVLDECDHLDATGGPLCRYTASCIRDAIADELGIACPPAAAPTGSQPSAAAGVPTLSDEDRVDLDADRRFVDTEDAATYHEGDR